MKLLTYFKQLVKPEENWPPGKVVSDLSHTHTSKQAKLVREREREREREYAKRQQSSPHLSFEKWRESFIIRI